VTAPAALQSSPPLLRFRDRYIHDIEGFVREVLKFPNATERARGEDIYPWQLRAMDRYNRRVRRQAYKSGHGVGKSTLAAWTLLHHILFRFPQRSAVTAPTEKQLFNALWANFKVWHSRLPPELSELVEVKNDRAEFKLAPAESYIVVNTARAEQPEALQGIHSEWSLLWADESSGIHDNVFEAGAGSMSDPGAMTVLTGNPVRGQGFFFDCFGKASELWETETVSSMDIPRIMQSDFVKQIETTYGRESNAFRVRVLGDFPKRDDDTVIAFELVEPCFDRDIVVPKTAVVIWGLDVARFGDNRTALAKRQTHQLLEPIKTWTQLDTMAVASRVKLEFDNTPQLLRPREINVDSIGVGAGVVDRLREIGLPARGINVSESPASVNAETYGNLRAELWFKARQWFEARDVKLPASYKSVRSLADDLVGELTGVRYKYRPGSGKIAVESKDEMKKRGRMSPDLADAFVLTFATDAIALAQGSYGSTNWNSKISRPLRGLV
jgi:phage terminase large subunit